MLDITIPYTLYFYYPLRARAIKVDESNKIAFVTLS